MAEVAHHHLCKLRMDEVQQQVTFLNLNHSLLFNPPLLLNHQFHQENIPHLHKLSQAALRYIALYQLLQYLDAT